MIKQCLFRLAKAPWMGALVGKAFQYASWAIPVKKIVMGPAVLAFYHPKPAYSNHVIITPKKAVRNLQQLTADDFVKIWNTAQSIVAANPEYRTGFTLAANGGKRQEVQQVHFHLFTDHPMVGKRPGWEIHEVIEPAVVNADAFRDILQCIELLDDRFGIVQKGYSLVYQCDLQVDGIQSLVFHVVAGKRL